MKDYNVVSLQTSYSVLENNWNKLHFINDVAIYYDKEKTNRDVFNIYSNFNAWLEEYSKANNIPLFEFRALIKSLVNEVQSQLLESFEPDNTFFIPEGFNERLNKIKEVGTVVDPYSYHNVLSLIFHYLPIQNNYSIVCKNGSFLMSKVRMILPWFYNNITISEYGLFKCEKREYRYDRYFPGSIKTSNSTYYWDSNGNYIRAYDFDKSLKLLSNCSSDYLTLLSEREDLNFNVGKKGGYFEYSEIYDGKEEVAWEKLRPDGLTFYYTESTVRGSDYRYYANPYVRDQFGNSVGVIDFYHSLEMLRNGKVYLIALINDSIERQICGLI